MITQAYSYFTQNGNTGYHDLSISYEIEGRYHSFSLRTGVEGGYQNFLLCDIDDILVGELTEKQQEYWNEFKGKEFYSDLVRVHDAQLIMELEHDLKTKINTFRTKFGIDV